MKNINFAKFSVCCKEVLQCDLWSFLLKVAIGGALGYYSSKYIRNLIDPTKKNKRKVIKRAEAQLHRLKTQRRLKVNWKTFDDYEMIIASQLVVPEDITVGWKDIAGLDTVIQEIRELVVLPLCHPELCNQSKLWQAPKGVLLYGPPGCGKTLIAKATAKESGMHFINLDVAMLTDKWYGESQKLVSAVFSLAQKIEPCIIFIDEIDSFLRSRTSNDHEVTAMMKTQFMALWDGLCTKNDSTVIVMGATNRPTDLDKAILRRMPTQYHIDLPTKLQRLSIMKLVLQGENVSKDVNYELLAVLTVELSGSDLHELCCLAAVNCMREAMRAIEAQLLAASNETDVPTTTCTDKSQSCISMEDLLQSLEKISISKVLTTSSNSEVD